MYLVSFTNLSKIKKWINITYLLCYSSADGVLSPQRTLPPALPPKSPRLVPAPQRRTISGPPSAGNGSDRSNERGRKREKERPEACEKEE